MTDSLGERRHAPATLRNREPILEVLSRVFATPGTILEIASGSGEHAAFFGERLPHLVWQPSDLDATALASIDAWVSLAGMSNVRPAIQLDATMSAWPVGPIDGIVCINMIHIAPIEACEGLLRGASERLAPGRALVLYGPFREGGVHTAPSNASFDEGLRARNPAWGVRNLDDVVASAAAHGFVHEETVRMPANNLTVVFRRTA
ncbi:SAM-dependent methyltransferase [Labilithrix luteola]|uniref:SAM-dependent methyltransferase n=1 Tax=Labilithrix luteola TaxID=1391654 RepID=A0A0K1QFJ8_9BACT|nr:DUF938 domain-containing protein [Labilithrix luteola]AKV04498.1 SAM-dependent methyltransferase [Labilithrix luteola]